MNNRQVQFEEHRDIGFLHPIVLVLPDLTHPVNVGSLFRVADAFALEKVYLTGKTPAPPNRRIRKSSRATEQFVPYAVEKNPRHVIQVLKKSGYHILCLERTVSSVDIRKLEVTSLDKICLVVGSEARGISDDLLELAEETVHIPMYGKNSSMNVSVATSIALYELLDKHYRVIQK